MKTETFRSVWDAIEDDPVVARAMERRSNLLLQVRKKIAEAKYSQAEAARILKISRPRVSDLQRGKINLFSLETLMEFLDRLGQEVRIEIRPARKRKSETV
ncbi:MAG: helix-turn-helix domain-containing protein [Parvibaculaceae bacterium]